MNEVNISKKTLDINKEILKCRLSMLYFIEHYIKIPVPGGLVTQKESDIWNATRKYKDLIKLLDSPNVDNVIFGASRQHGKTTTIVQAVLHNLLFFPGLKIEFLTLSKKNAEDVIERLKFMYDNLPDWLKLTKPNGRTFDRKTYIEFDNKSKFNTRYISGNISPDQIARGMSVPYLWVDEAAFIPHMEDAWAAAQPAIATARKFAKLNNYPTKIIVTSTPNGAGENWFYKNWIAAWDYEEIFDFEKNKPLLNTDEIVNSADDKNNFIKVRIHWSETGKDEAWYKKQVKELGFNMRKVNQELNLVFLGSQYTVFADEILAEFEPKNPVISIDFGYGNKFAIFEDINEIIQENRNEVFILGIDTAISTAAKADYSAITLTRASTGEQIGEWHGKVSVLKRYASLVKKLTRTLIDFYNLDEDNFKIIIERNSIGMSILEELSYDDDFDFGPFLFKTEIRKGEIAPGIQTKKDTREKMFDLLLSMISENPKLVKGPLIQEELRNLEQKSNGRIEAGKGSHDDIIMAYNFTLYVRDLLIKSGDVVVDNTKSKKSAQVISNFIETTFSSLNRFDKEIENNLKISNHEDLQLVYEISDEEKRKLKKKEKELREIWKPAILNDDDDVEGYDVLIF